jgi:hypothetical protein
MQQKRILRQKDRRSRSRTVIRFTHHVLRITRYALRLLPLLLRGVFAYPPLIALEDEDFSPEQVYLGYDDIVKEFRGKKCKSCHPAIWREWESSMHAEAWKDPIFQEAASQVKDREKKCDPCHAPEPILITGVGNMPKLRKTDQDFGVSCLVCHMDKSGAMHGPPASIDAMFHANITSEAHMNPTALCGTCHGQPSVPEHSQLASFKEGKAAKEGKNCATCHMPAITRLQSTASFEKIPGRRHTWIGGRSVQMLKSAAELTIQRSEKKAIVSVANQAGHHIPGDALRAIILDVKISGASGNIIQSERISISATSGEGGSDNRIQADETHRFEFEMTPKQNIEAKLRYRLLSTTPEAEWMTMAEAIQSF